MIWFIIGFLLVLWLLGVVLDFVVGGLLHILLFIAIGIFVYRLVKGKRIV